MAKQLNVNLAFTADTGKAKAQLQDLQKQLSNLTIPKSNSQGLSITPAIQKATEQAALLKAQLEQATNIKTGKLDLGKFSQSLDKSGMTLEMYRKNLEKLGPDGAKAFASLATSIGNAEVPLRRTNALLSEMWVSLKNTARWQISSSILHGFMGSLQSAYGYAQDLNESLNNIRIVTGYDTDQMSKFAKEANNAAKALSATTTEYTNASLIYYQQGLNTQEVKERTDITIKMANVARESAEIVSDQLTAIWNNFAENGTQSLEHYADAMTALGAKTASSTDEIAGGLEKFASIADMIGLSFDNAAAALATITAATRQSEDVVGTALKTIFARIQGLNLGETLDDGTTLNKYSEALAKVGISIYDSVGGLKDMDTILEEMGSKWNTLTDAQQVALAQTVAGVRQYNQLVSLMENFDVYQENILTAKTADGTLDKQAEIYAESWEAAQDRVTAAAEKIYSSLLDDDFFITLLDSFAVVLEGIDGMIDGLGGLKGVLLAISAITTKVFGAQMAKGLNDMAYNVQMLTPGGYEKVQNRKNEAWDEVSKLSANLGTEEGFAQSESYKQTAELQKSLLQNAQNMNEEELKQNQILLDGNKILQERAILEAKRLDSASQEVSDYGKKVRAESKRAGVDRGKYIKAYSKLQDDAQAYSKANSSAQRLKKAISASSGDIQKLKKEIDNIENSDGFDGASKELAGLINEIKNATTAVNNLDAKMENVQFAQDDKWVNSVDKFQKSTKVATGTADQMGAKLLQVAEAQQRQAIAAEEAANSTRNLKLKFEQAGVSLTSFSRSAIATAQTVSSIGMAITSLSGAFKTLTDPDTTGIEKLGVALSTLGFVVPILTSSLSRQSLQQMTTFSTSLKLALGYKTATVEATKATIATGSYGAALWTTLWPIAAAATAIGVLIAAFSKLSEAVENASPEGQLKKLEEEAEKSTEAFNNVNDAIENTNSTLKKLEDASATIQNLTADTTEWYKAISEVNAEVMKLTEQYDGLSEYLTLDKNGMMSINQEGKDWLDTENRSRLTAANNRMLTDQIAVDEQKIHNSFYEFKDLYGGQLESGLAMALQSAYGDIGDYLFTQDYASQLLKALEEAGYLFSYSQEELYETINLNKDLIKQNDEIRSSIDILRDSQIASVASSSGSTRTIQSVKDLVGENAYEDLKNKKRTEIINTDSNGWNYSINYNSQNDPERWKQIQDFVRIKGAERGTSDVEYVAQRRGQMVLKIDGEEEKFSSSDFYDTLAEEYTAPEYEKLFISKIKDSLSESLSSAVNDLSVKDIIQIDNFQNDLIATLTESGELSEEEASKAFKNLSSAFGTDALGLEEFANSTKYIDLTSNKFADLVKNIDDIEKLKEEIQTLNAEGELNAMGDFFTDAAEKMGLKEEDATAMHEYAKALREMAEESDILDDDLAKDAKSAAKLAVQITRMNKGINDLANGFEDWKDVLKNSSKESFEYFEAMSGIKKSLSDVLDVEEDLISSEFVNEHLDEIEKAAKGDAEAIDFLTSQMDEEIIQKISLSQPEDIQAEIKALDDVLKEELDRINVEIPDIEIGTLVQDQAFLDAANNLVEKSKMTADEANAYFAGIGYEPVYAAEEIDTSSNMPNSLTKTTLENLDWNKQKVDLGPFGEHELEIPSVTLKTESIPDKASKAPGSTTLVSFSGDQAPPKIKGMVKKATGTMNNYSSANSGGSGPGKKSGGGGGSKPKKNKGTDKSKVIDRYKEITDQLSKLSNTTKDVNRETGQLFGVDKLKNLEKENKLILENINLLEQKRKEAEAYLEIDKQALLQAAEAAGVSLNIDPETNLITNYTEAMTELFNRLDEAHKAAGDTIDEAEQEVIDGIQEKIDVLKEAIKQFDDTRKTMEDTEDEKKEKLIEWKENNYTQLTTELELNLLVDENKMKELDYYFEKMEGDIEKAVEAFGILQDKLDTTSEKLFDYEDHFNSLEQAYAAGQISQADYIDGLQECYDALYDNIEALNDLDKQMMEYYGETYDLALEKIETYTSQMEHLSSVLDHYKSIMSLLGKESDFETMGVIIEGQVKVAEDSYKSSKSIYELAKGQKEAAYEELMSAENDAERELLQKNYDKALEEFNNAQETMLDDAETYGELIKEALVNSMNQAAKEMEKALTGVWGSFENLQEQMGLHSTHQEEFLTNTNKLYETNKLLNQVAQDMEKTDNRASKAKYQAFSKEIEQLQEKDKLSKLELEIAQAKYNMLQAQIALEEAQNAKSMVRLTRDEEGNYGYVYTADKDKVNQAEQDLADAENDLYNIRLNATNDYAEKIVQARADMLDKLKELDERAAEDEEYRLNQYENDKANIQKAYYDLIDDYSRLHAIAQEEDVRVQQDAWTNFYSDVIDQGEDWKNAITDYNNKIILSFEEWEAKSDLLTEAIAEDITDVTDASENLKDTLVEDVIPAMADTLDEVRTLTAEYALQRESVLNLADAYGVLAGNIKEAIREEAQKAKNANSELQNTDTTKDPNAQVQETRPADAGPGSSSSSSSSGGDGVLNVGDEVTFTGGVYYNDAEGGGPTGSRGPGKKVKVDRIKPGSNYPIHVISGDSAFGWLREDQLSGFNTGGYTGEWGAEGKLALLHEKELVLNAVDTENLLASVQILRELTKAIDLNATWASMGIGSLNAVGVSDTSTTLEQKVEIRAEFPNATDHNEIEEAFNTLINRASQYANRF